MEGRSVFQQKDGVSDSYMLWLFLLSLHIKHILPSLLREIESEDMEGQDEREREGERAREG